MVYLLLPKMASGGRDANTSEETFEYLCTSCSEENYIKEGIKYCVECQGYCCKNCVYNHKKYPTLREHSLMDISDSQHGDQSTKLPSFPTEKCEIHQGKVIDMYCGDHDVVGCYVCTAIDHKNCTYIHFIPDDVDQIANYGEFDRTDKILNALTESVRSTLHNTDDVYLQNIERAKQNALLAITEHRMATIAILDRLTENAQCEVESIYEQMKTNVLYTNRRIKLSINTVLEIREKFRIAEGNKAQQFVCLNVGSSAIKKEENNIKDYENELEVFKEDHVFSFVVENSVAKFLQRVEKIGNLTIRGSNTAYHN